jgi:molybdopterin molybdotransferase
MLAALDKAADTDVIVTSGGASVGDHDLVRPALAQWGATIDFLRVAMRPGIRSRANCGLATRSASRPAR